MPSQSSLVQHILRIALAVGLVLGLILFSVLLYVSDFGGTPAAPAQGPAAQATATTAAAPTPATPDDPARQALQWVFGAPKNPDTTAP